MPRAQCGHMPQAPWHGGNHETCDRPPALDLPCHAPAPGPRDPPWRGPLRDAHRWHSVAAQDTSPALPHADGGQYSLARVAPASADVSHDGTTTADAR